MKVYPLTDLSLLPSHIKHGVNSFSKGFRALFPALEAERGWASTDGTAEDAEAPYTNPARPLDSSDSVKFQSSRHGSLINCMDYAAFAWTDISLPSAAETVRPSL